MSGRELSEIIAAMCDAAGRDRAQRLERACVDAAILLASEDGEHGVANPRELHVVHHSFPNPSSGVMLTPAHSKGRKPASE